MVIRIDPQSAEPIFEQIVFQVKGACAQGTLKPGDKLLSVREQARELSVNPNTVIRAYEALERDGVVVRRQGAGCFITNKKIGLSQQERRRQLNELVLRAVTEAYHLGCGPDEILKALEKALKSMTFAKDEGRTS